ncbi:uncharacterized protein BDV17DRAFT_150995 [Aspergillus undulatus]|uniref:uncharacterized protein n=1 Tax=Aspergillus undulatus TaxID=1810928 RepID=UPI003CCCA6FB
MRALGKLHPPERVVRAISQTAVWKTRGSASVRRSGHPSFTHAQGRLPSSNKQKCRDRPIISAFNQAIVSRLTFATCRKHNYCLRLLMSKSLGNPHRSRHQGNHARLPPPTLSSLGPTLSISEAPLYDVKLRGFRQSKKLLRSSQLSASASYDPRDCSYAANPSLTQYLRRS